MKIENDELIKKWEELRLTAYMPTPNDVWTIGWGHTRTARQGMVITKEQAQALFEKDIAWVEAAIDKHVKVPLKQHQHDVIGSWVFNVGERAMARSTLLKKLNAKDYQGAADQLLLWNKQKGKTLRGLTRRRTEERDYFLGKGEAYRKYHSEPRKVTTPPEAVGGSLVAIGLASGAAVLQDHTSLLMGLSGAVAALLVGVVLYRIYKNKRGV